MKTTSKAERKAKAPVVAAHPVPKNVVVRPNFTAKAKEEGKLPMAQYARALILKGFSDLEITEGLKKHYRLPKKHLHYARWYRYELVRKGVLTHEQAFATAGEDPVKASAQ